VQIVIQVLQSQKKIGIILKFTLPKFDHYPTPIVQNNLIIQSNHNYFQPMKIQLSKSLSNLYVVNNANEDCWASFSLQR
jgi:hypothetical protein